MRILGFDFNLCPYTEALAAVVKELRREAAALKAAENDVARPGRS